jgi:hypothetical protein
MRQPRMSYQQPLFTKMLVWLNAGRKLLYC